MRASEQSILIAGIFGKCLAVVGQMSYKRSMEKRNKVSRHYRIDPDIDDRLAEILAEPNCDFHNQTELVCALLRKALGLQPRRPKLPTVKREAITENFSPS